MTPDQEGLIRKARQSIESARLQRDHGFYDFAVSRAYYAMFYIAEAFLRGQGLTFSKHSAVIAKFGELFAKPGKVPAEFHRYLITAQEARHQGDYDIESGLTESDADSAIANAEKFLELAREKIGELPTP